MGFAFDNVLVYVKGGFAAGEISTKKSIEGYGGICFFKCGVVGSYEGSGSTNERHYGWTIGAGGAVKLTPNISLGIDYGYIDLRSKTHNGTLSGDLSVFHVDVPISKDYALKVDPDDIHTVNARFTVHFN